jgi:hypothetical protein
MSAVYENFGVSFMYPENWQLADESGPQDAGPKTISVHSPSGAFWSLQVCDPPADPQSLADQFKLTMAAEYEGLEAFAAAEEVADLSLLGYDMDFYCLDFVISANVRAARVGQRVYVISCQAETREFDELSPVFKAMTISLLREK